MNAATVPCPGCGRPIDPRTATLSAIIGQPVCPSCIAHEALASAQDRGAKSLAWGSLSAAMGGWVFLMMSFMVCGLGHIASLAAAIGAIITGVRSLRYLAREEYQRSESRVLLYAATVGGIVLASLLLLAYAGVIMVLGAAAVLGHR